MANPVTAPSPLRGTNANNAPVSVRPIVPSGGQHRYASAPRMMMGSTTTGIESSSLDETYNHHSHHNASASSSHSSPIHNSNSMGNPVPSNTTMTNNNNNVVGYASNRSLTPSRYTVTTTKSYESNTGNHNPNNNNNNPGTPSSTGLIRLSLKKPMGIVFEPMYDPNQKSVQRGVRICDLPRTGAAALSRKLQVGDELLQINDTTVSRLNFDAIMDFIIKADPECVNLLFRRPRKELLQARNNVPQKLHAAANKDTPSTVKWIDEDNHNNNDQQQQHPPYHPDHNPLVGGGGDAVGAVAVAQSAGMGAVGTTPNSSGGGGAQARKSNSSGGLGVATKSDLLSPNKKSTPSSKKEAALNSNSNNNNKKTIKRNKKAVVSEDEEETQQSSTVGDESYSKRADDERTGGGKHSSSRKKGKSNRQGDPYESESFLDILIDTICNNSSSVCRDAFSRRTGDDEYLSEDDESFVTDIGEDESTYLTVGESVERRRGSGNGGINKSTKSKKNMNPRSNKKPETIMEDEDATRNDLDDSDERGREKHKVAGTTRKDKIIGKIDPVAVKQQPPVVESKKKYEDDGTLESVESTDRVKVETVIPVTNQLPLGLASSPPPIVSEAAPPKNLLPVLVIPEPEEDGPNPTAPIREVEYDERFDHGADVSVMESLGGPSLLIEKQRATLLAAQLGLHGGGARKVPIEIMDQYGQNYPHVPGLTREQSIDADPLKFYIFVVKRLLDEHEPEKVRLLDKLLAKYKGREDHLVQKLSVRYDRPSDDPARPSSTPVDDPVSFSDAVAKSKASSNAAAAVHTAKERMQVSEQHPQQQSQMLSDMNDFDEPRWPEKDTKEPEIGDEVLEEEEDSNSGSEYSRDSVDGTSPAVIAQVSELLNYVYGKTSVPGQIDRVSTIMRAYEGREAVLLELLETKALIKANKEKENAENLPTFLRNSQHHMAQAQRNLEDVESSDLPPVTPMATATQALPAPDDLSSMSGVSTPARDRDMSGIVQYHTEDVEVTHTALDLPDDMEISRIAPSTMRSGSKPPMSNLSDQGGVKQKKKGLFSGLFGRKPRDVALTPSSGRAGSRQRSQSVRKK